jgi:hypothetical protein
MLIDLHLQGRLRLEKFVSGTVGLDDVEKALHGMEGGEVLRSVVIRQSPGKAGGPCFPDDTSLFTWGRRTCGSDGPAVRRQPAREAVSDGH